jgi:hypothetical protein
MDGGRGIVASFLNLCRGGFRDIFAVITIDSASKPALASPAYLRVGFVSVLLVLEALPLNPPLQAMVSKI